MYNKIYNKNAVFLVLLARRKGTSFGRKRTGVRGKALQTKNSKIFSQTTKY
ncbi:hypothetical protein [Brachyspira sp. SAP_772]|uniref:hypothetical protein n=1 Tax=Brachyspira sp. SAP_772 TaxID=2608385 RepID=UPI0012F4FF6E|nr:hypothetical protein [Brachyspira sp. SAP_772]